MGNTKIGRLNLRMCPIICCLQEAPFKYNVTGRKELVSEELLEIEKGKKRIQEPTLGVSTIDCSSVPGRLKSCMMATHT